MKPMLFRVWSGNAAVLLAGILKARGLSKDFEDFEWDLVHWRTFIDNSLRSNLVLEEQMELLEMKKGKRHGFGSWVPFQMLKGNTAKKGNARNKNGAAGA